MTIETEQTATLPDTPIEPDVLDTTICDKKCKCIIL
jgi:hypothetical protein